MGAQDKRVCAYGAVGVISALAVYRADVTALQMIAAALLAMFAAAIIETLFD